MLVAKVIIKRLISSVVKINNKVCDKSIGDIKKILVKLIAVPKIMSNGKDEISILKI